MKSRVFLSMLCLLGLLLSGCQGLQPAGPTPAADTGSETPPTARVISATGVVVPAQWARLSLSAAGVVAQVLVAEGDTVQAGQPLVRLAGGDDQAPPAEVQAAIAAGELEVQLAEQALAQLDREAQAAWLQAGQSLSTLAAQIRDRQYQLDTLDVPDEQASLAPHQAYDQARQAYERAQTAFAPYQDEPAGNATRRERQQDLDQAREDYDAAVTRWQLQLALETAQATQAQALQDYAAFQTGPSADDLALALKRLDSARAALSAARAALEGRTLLAPFAGTVTEIPARLGEWLAPGMPAVVLADLGQLRVETTDLNEIDMAQIRVGDPVSVTFDAIAGVIAAGRVVFIAPGASPGAGVNYRAVVEMQSTPAQLRWGMSAFVDILPDG